MSDIFPRVKATEFSEAPIGYLVAGEIHRSVGLAIVVGEGNDKLLLCLSVGKSRHHLELTAENRELLLIDHKFRISFDANTLVDMPGFYEPEALGFLLSAADGHSSIVCSGYDGFGRENILVKADDWTLLDKRPSLRIGTNKWRVEILDPSCKRWVCLYDNVGTLL